MSNGINKEKFTDRYVMVKFKNISNSKKIPKVFTKEERLR